MLACLTSLQIAEWMAYAEIDGLRSAKQDYALAGQICATIANFNGFRGKGSKNLEPADFFGFLKEEKAEAPVIELSAEDQSALIIRSLFKNVSRA